MSNSQQLIKLWIQHLKNKQIVSQQSDPRTGKLAYKRRPTSTDLINFLTLKTEYSDEQIYNAVSIALDNEDGAVASSNAVAAGSSSETDNVYGAGKSTRQKPPSDVEDVPYREYSNIKQLRTDSDPDKQKQISRDKYPQLAGLKKNRGGKKPGVLSQTPNAIRKRKARAAKRNLGEDVADIDNEFVTEQDVENVFNILQQSAHTSPEKSTPDAPSPVKQEDELDKLTAFIDTKMTPQQRRFLYQALQKDTLSEEQISKDQVRDILSTAAKTRAHSILRKDRINLTDLQQSWKDINFSLDTDDIGKLLKRTGYSEEEINAVFNKVLDGVDTDNEYEDTDEVPAADAIMKIAEYAKQHGLSDELIQFMEARYSDELIDQPEQPDPGIFSKAKNWFSKKFNRTATVEEVREIFSAILLTERTLKNRLIKEEEKRNLGRSKK